VGSVHNDLFSWASKAASRGHSTIEVNVDTAIAAADEITSLSQEVAELRAKLMGLADSHEVCGMSWNGFNVVGDKESIDEVKRLQHRSSQLETYARIYDERVTVLEDQLRLSKERNSE
jgi:hypothetical protein